MKSILLIFALSSSVFSQNRTSIFRKPNEIAIEKQVAEKSVKKMKTQINQNHFYGNLPLEYAGSNSSFSIEESPIVVPINRTGVKFSAIKSGDLIHATIQESVFAFEDSKSPVRALITSGELKGSILIGEANLEKNSKRILLEFKKFRDPIQKDIFQIQASAMDEKGILGLVGNLVSNEGKYFAAEVISAGAAGYADSTISRSQNSLGNQVEVQSEDTFVKKALTAALSKTADRFSEKLKRAPEYSILEGPISIQILVLEQPVLIQ